MFREPPIFKLKSSFWFRCFGVDNSKDGSMLVTV